MYCEAELEPLPDVLGVLALERRLVPDFDVAALIRTRNDEEWIADATFALQLFNGESLCRNSTTVPSRRQNERTDLRLAAGLPTLRYPLDSVNVG